MEVLHFPIDAKILPGSALKNENSEIVPVSENRIQEDKFISERKAYRIPGYKENPIHSYYQDIFENQREFGKKIATMFLNLSLLNVLAIAPTQSGKTGSMVAVIYEFFNSSALRMPKSNIFVFTGHSSLEWLEQTKERFPEWLHPHIYHRNHLKKIVGELKNRKNVLIIIDECHIACKPHQTIDKLFDECSYKNQSHMYENNIKFVQFTATPENINAKYEDTMKEAHAIATMDVPDQYLSIEKLEKQGRIFSAKDLCGELPLKEEDKPKTVLNSGILENINEIGTIVDSMEPSYHIIRTPRGPGHEKVISNFKQAFSEKEFLYFSEPMMKNDEMDTLLETKPTQHTFIFIKDKLRCAKTIHHEFIGVLYDRLVKKPNQSSTIQGLLGRLTGYHANTNAIVFTCPFEIDIIEEETDK